MALNSNLFSQLYNNVDKESIMEIKLTKETPIENYVTNLAHHGIVVAAYEELNYHRGRCRVRQNFHPVK